MSTAPESTNAHFSADPEGKKVVDLDFLSEALGMPAADGYGWAQFEFGDQIGDASKNPSRYTIVRKLGWGMHSSVWLARDGEENKFIAVKALTGHMTKMHEQALSWEADALHLLSYGPASRHCLELLDEFTIDGKGSAGSHICFIFPLYGGDVKMLSHSRDTAFPFPLAKRISLHLLRGLAHAHERGVVHTDLKHDNVFYANTMKTEAIEAWIEKDSSRRHPPEASHDGLVQAAVSQPLPMITEDEAFKATYVLADFGSAHYAQHHPNLEITTTALRSPEAYLGGEWNTSTDVWSFGCLIFEFVTGKHFFRYKDNPKFGLDPTENMLYQMIMHTGGENFGAEQLGAWPKAAEYFKGDCSLKKEVKVIHWPISARIKEVGIPISDEEVQATTALMQRCLHLNPAERASAKELLSDPWFDGVD